MMNLKPLNDRVLIRREKPPEKTGSGLHIPESAQDKPQTAEVLAVGPGKCGVKTGARQPIEVIVGDRIVIGKWTGEKVPGEGNEDLLIVKEDDILAVLT